MIWFSAVCASVLRIINRVLFFTLFLALTPSIIEVRADNNLALENDMLERCKGDRRFDIIRGCSFILKSKAYSNDIELLEYAKARLELANTELLKANEESAVTRKRIMTEDNKDLSKFSLSEIDYEEAILKCSHPFEARLKGNNLKRRDIIYNIIKICSKLIIDESKPNSDQIIKAAIFSRLRWSLTRETISANELDIILSDAKSLNIMYPWDWRFYFIRSIAYYVAVNSGLNRDTNENFAEAHRFAEMAVMVSKNSTIPLRFLERRTETSHIVRLKEKQLRPLLASISAVPFERGVLTDGAPDGFSYWKTDAVDYREYGKSFLLHEDKRGILFLPTEQYQTCQSGGRDLRVGYVAFERKEDPVFKNEIEDTKYFRFLEEIVTKSCNTISANVIFEIHIAGFLINPDTFEIFDDTQEFDSVLFYEDSYRRENYVGRTRHFAEILFTPHDVHENANELRYMSALASTRDIRSIKDALSSRDAISNFLQQRATVRLIDRATRVAAQYRNDKNFDGIIRLDQQEFLIALDFLRQQFHTTDNEVELIIAAREKRISDKLERDALRALWNSALRGGSTNLTGMMYDVAGSASMLLQSENIARESRKRRYAVEGKICTARDSLAFCTYTNSTSYSYIPNMLIGTTTYKSSCSSPCEGLTGWCDLQTGKVYIDIEHAERDNCKVAN